MSENKKAGTRKKRTLSPSDIETTASVGRRSALDSLEVQHLPLFRDQHTLGVEHRDAAGELLELGVHRTTDPRADRDSRRGGGGETE